MIQILTKDHVITPVITTFPDHTRKIDLPSEFRIPNTGNLIIQWFYESEDELVILQFLTMHLRNTGIKDIYLMMPYIPNARMDRIESKHEVFTLKCFAQILNSLEFKEVVCLDPHSHVSEALIDRLTVVDEIPYNVNLALEHAAWNNENTILYFPDEGAMKRYKNIASKLHMPYLFGMKNRDWKTGDIKGIQVMGNTDLLKNHENILIVDDICSYGGTFYHSARAIKKLAPDAHIRLYITHCESSILKGNIFSSGLIEHVYTTNSLFHETHPDMTVFNLNITDDKLFE